MKIFIRADGGSSIGMGHVMRMLVLAEELRKTNEVIFICRSSRVDSQQLSTSVDKDMSDNINDKYMAGIEKMKENKFEVINVDENNVVKDILKIQKKYKADMIITDSYDVNEDYFNDLKPYFSVTGYVDDVNKCKMNVDFIINQNINAKELNYGMNTNKDTKLFLGTIYCMIREEFSVGKSSEQIYDKCENLLLTLGGMDKDFNTLKILKQLIGDNINFHVVVGKAFPQKLVEDLYELSRSYTNIKIYENAKMSELMKECDIAVSSCGSTLYELCAMNVPAIGVIIAENQLEVALEMKKKKLIANAYLANEENFEQLKIELDKLMLNKNLRNQIIKKQKEIVNINGVKLLADKIMLLK